MSESVETRRWVHTLDLRSQTAGSPNQGLSGCRGAADPGNLWFDLLNHKPERPAMDDLWAMFHQLSTATRQTGKHTDHGEGEPA